MPETIKMWTLSARVSAKGANGVRKRHCLA